MMLSEHIYVDHGNKELNKRFSSIISSLLTMSSAEDTADDTQTFCDHYFNKTTCD